MKFVGLVTAFLIIIAMVFLSIGFISTQHAPDPINNTEAYNQFQNQTATVELAYTGINGGILLLILAFVLSAAFLIIKAIS